MCDICENISFDQIVKSLCKTAMTGLARFYPESSDILPYSASIKSHDKWESSGISPRYAAISQIGIAKWLRYHPTDNVCLPNLWVRIVKNFDEITHVGDLALALWAGAASEADNCEMFARALVANWSNQKDLCNAVELGWIVQACTLAVQERDDLESIVWPILSETRTLLVRLFRPRQALFQRHNRPGLKEIVSRRIACFADQVYPILAMATYGKYFDDKQSIEIAALATEQICRYQGKLGQWWWHYDVDGGKICEEYPVFSVHQDSMAPMAIRTSDKVSIQDHSKEIKLGMFWLFGGNELEVPLVHTNEGIIWRSIEKREPDKLSRKVGGLCSVTGLSGLHRLAGKCIRGLRINRECRPYHLGWILYAWADHDTN